MSAALNALPDLSAQSSNTHPELSLGSLLSGFSTPARSGRIPSTTTSGTAASSAPVSTPTSSHAFSTGLATSRTRGAFGSRKNGMEDGRRNLNVDDDQDDADGDVLGTPGAEKKLWGDAAGVSILGTPGPTTATSRASGASKKVGGKGTTLTLRDQEKHIDNLKKENFNIKLRVHFLEERLAQLAPDELDAVIKQNINLKIEVQEYRVEFKKQKKLIFELERELAKLQQQQQQRGGSRDRERELEEKLDEREREIRDLRRRLAANGSTGDRDDVDAGMLRELEDRNMELENELENARAIMEDNMDELERLRETVERKRDEDDTIDSTTSSALSSRTQHGLRRRVDDLEVENGDLRARLDKHIDALAQVEDEKEDLMDEVETLRLSIEDVQRRREAESIERSESRAQVLEEREEREAVEDDLNAMKDRLAAVMIELQQREEEVELKNREIEDLVKEHERIVSVVDEEWRGEVEETKNMVEELRDVIAERDTESKELRLNIAELEANTEDLHNKFEAALAHVEQDAAQKDNEIEQLNAALEKLSEQIYVLEDEHDRLKEESERIREDEAAERERLEALAAALKDKVASLKSQLDEVTERYETCNEEIHIHRSRQEELARHVEDLVASAEHERSLREEAEAALESANRAHMSASTREQRQLEAKDSALQAALRDLNSAQALASQREKDLAALQGSLAITEKESRRLGEAHGTAKLSLQLEVDRLKRDLERLEDELRRARKELEEKEARYRDKDGLLDKLHAENRDLTSQVATQTQARLNLAEKLDSALAAARSAEGEVAAYKTRVGELEGRMMKDQRSLLSAENLYRDQLTERNTLLLTIYQYMDKILGVDKTPKKGGHAETKPFTNFSVFHDNLITRLKALSQIQLDFDKRCKDVEARFTEKMGEMRKQLDTRWKQIDRFEANVKTYADTKVTWKKKLMAKEGELEALKTTNSELSAHLSSMRRPGPSDSMEVRSLSARAVNAERRLQNAQNQLVATEEKIAAMNKKSLDADNKWDARVKEYESMLKKAEERYKRERQGGKETVKELENNLRSLQKQLEVAQKRNQQLGEIVESNRTPAGQGSPGTR
ncbi:hypothetical protein BDN72DRAFT_841829 [Pluteus cervinus]|uniref:Uncharacterized protein n=1 Tax=Pluteus cervinus TaxID=181527 RepID=A0ACD3AS14_9AGAR|nr:hypothetical protein BDN72DRAFT_841829 [Pluteus cervinus]